ncbi:N-acetyltransferase [Pseudonocardia sp. N23]|uniref:GNAT family N-acetyltransferase n=1 Tax=Pseudonocardia sp. N23 TaxID=1987376 RepID=UPI000BFDE277|nr:GNAT family N-acetyltransferase [Pseudonocardia sp. N23]GAY13202.1 GCN5-related N-acetyltransferase [Pseudonocardia sp. N23]
MTAASPPPGPGRVALDALVGSRVALRHLIGERDGRPLFTDAVGTLSDGGERDGVATVVVATRRGDVVVARDKVVAAREVPPATPRRAPWTDVTRLQHLCADAWPALVDRPLGGWRLRAADGFSGRANAALAVGDPGVGTGAALALVRGFADEHGLAPRVLAPLGSPWSRAVRAEGWVPDAAHEPGPEVSTQVTACEAVADDAGTVIVSSRPDAAWWSVALGGPPTEAQRHVLAPAAGGRIADVGFGVAGDPADPAGVVRLAVVDDHLHVARLAVTPSGRRRGTGTTLVAGAARWGLEHGARWLVLQVSTANPGGLAFWASLGTTEHHRYHYLVPG